MCANEELQIIGAVCIRIAIKPFSAENHLMELAQDRSLLVCQRLVNHIIKLRDVDERHAADAYLRKEVVLARLAVTAVAVVIPSAVETCVIKVGRDIVALIDTARLHMAVEAAVRHYGDIAAQHHHSDAVVLVFLDDIVTNLILVVDAVHSGVDIIGDGDSVSHSDGVVIVAILAVSLNKLRTCDDKDVVCCHLTAFRLVVFHHLGVLSETTDAVFHLLSTPQHVAMVSLGSSSVYSHIRCLGIHHLAFRRDVLDRGERGEGEAVSVFVLSGQNAMILSRIHAFRSINLFVYYQISHFVVAHCT